MLGALQAVTLRSPTALAWRLTVLLNAVEVEREQLGHTQARVEAGSLEPTAQDKPPLHGREP